MMPSFPCGRPRRWPWALRLRLRPVRAALFDLGDHFLFGGHGHRAAAFGVGPGNARVGFGLIGLQSGADVLAHVDVGDVDRHDFERGLRIEPRASTALEIMSGFSSTALWSSAEPIALTMPSPTRAMIVSSVAPPMSCCRFARTVTRALHLELDAVLGHGVERLPRPAAGRAIDHFGIDAGLHGFEHIAAGQVDGGGFTVRKSNNFGLVGGDQARESPAGHCRRPGNGLRATCVVMLVWSFQARPARP